MGRAKMFRQNAVQIMLGIAMLGATAHAQEAARPPAAVEPRAVAPGLWVIDETPAHGGSVSIFAGSGGTLLVDTGVESWAPAVDAAIRRLAKQPIRYVINTHSHVDEIGGNAYFANKGATIIGQDRTRSRIINRKPPPPGADGRTRRQTKSFPPETAPVITFDQMMTLVFNEQAVRLIAVPAAHTDNDIFIHFPEIDVIIVGDVLRAGEFPSINRADGGTLNGMIAGLDRLLALAGPQTWLVTSHGQVVHREAAEAQHHLLLTARDRVSALIAQNKSLEDVQSADVTHGLGAKALPGHVSAEQFVKDLYQELAARR